MLQIQESSWSTTRWASHIASTLLFAASLCGLASCGDSGNKSADADTATSEFNEERCDTLVTSAIEGLRPTRLTIDSEIGTALATLNQWMNECGKSEAAPQDISPKSLDLLKAIASPQQLEHLNDTRFSSRDGYYVRDCLLAKAVSGFATAGSNNSLDRVVDLFEYVTRNIDLVQPTENSAPLTFFTSFFFGQGTPQDRALVFASLLRQLGIDAVIIRPRSADTADAKPDDRQWLVGVLLDGNIYLFDMRLGTPIPSPADTGDTPTVRRPATLAEVKKNDGLLRALDLPAGKAYPLRAENLAAPHVEVIGTTSVWARRLERLQQVLTGDRYLIVYDPLDDQGKNPGLLKRVAEGGAGHWQPGDIGIWSYPETMLHKFDQRTPEQQAAFDLKQRPFHAPIPLLMQDGGSEGKTVVIDANTKTAKMGLAKNEHQRARVFQLAGSYQKAITRYTEALIAERYPPGIPVHVEFRLTQQEAADNAIFWNGVCLMEQSQPGAAIISFRNYLRRHPQDAEKGPWDGFCRGLLALSLAKTGNYAGAVTELAAVPASDPKKDGYEFFSQRWKKLAEKKTSKDAAQNAEKSPTPPAAAPATPTPAPADAAKKEPGTESQPAPAPEQPAPAADKAAEPKADAEKKSP